MVRIIALSLIIISISGLAVAEVATEPKFQPKAYTLDFLTTRYTIIAPLDKDHSVLIADKEGNDNYMIEGILARTVAQAVKFMAGEPKFDKQSKKLISEMVKARAVYLGGEKAVLAEYKRLRKRAK